VKAVIDGKWAGIHAAYRKGGDKAALPCPVNNRQDAVHGTQHHAFRRRLVARWFSALELEADWLSYSKRCCWCGVDARKTKIPAAAKVGAARSDVPRSHVRIAVVPSPSSSLRTHPVYRLLFAVSIMVAWKISSLLLLSLRALNAFAVEVSAHMRRDA